MACPPTTSAVQIPEMQGSSSELRVEVTVIRAENIPHIRIWLRMKRRFFVTVTCQAKTAKSASVKIEGQVVEWNEKLDTLFVQPSTDTRLLLRLYAKRFLHRDILIGTHELAHEILPTSTVGSTNVLSLDLSKGNTRQARQPTQPVTLTVTVSAANAIPAPSPPSLPFENPPGHPVAKGVPRAVGTIPTNFLPSFEFDTADAGTSAGQSGLSTPTITTGPETTIDDIIKTVKRFRILSVGRSGVGKSSLINSVFGINAAHVEDHKPGKADIQQELVSPENQYFVLHDSKGFEPGDHSNFETVRDFVANRSRPEVPLSERIHGLWLCIETPTAGGRALETGDERLLQFAHENQVPIVIVFTQYDRLVRTKEAQLREGNPNMETNRLRDQSLREASMAFDYCLELIQRKMKHLGIPMPRYASVSVRLGHHQDVSSLVKVTRDIVKERVKGDAWALWSIAQRASVPVTIDLCLTKGLSYYRRALTEMGQSLLRNCLEIIHKDIITCWNFKGEVLHSPEFRQLMLYLVQDVYTKPNASIPPDVINRSVTPVNTASAPNAPPITIQDLPDIFEQWLSTAVLENAPSEPVQRLLIAYPVDLIRVLTKLFDVTLQPELALTTTQTLTWRELRTAFDAYERSSSRQRIREIICSKTTQDEQILTADGTSRKIRELLQDVSSSRN